LAGIYSMFILLFIFLIAAMAMQAFLGEAALTNANNQNDVLYFFATQISGTPVAYLMVLGCSRRRLPPLRRRCCHRAG